MSDPTSQPSPKSGSAGQAGLTSSWTPSLQPPWATQPIRLEGEIADLPVYGAIPPEIDGTFYRIMVDPFYPPLPENNIPIEGDGNVCAFRIHNGRVDMKTKYVDTERLKLERKANRRLFGLYRNPFTHHPCVRAAVDSTANTNLVMWAGHLLALKEVALPYAIDPDTLETLSYDPFGQVKAKTFTAHPKVDPYSEELVVYGYEAKSLMSSDIVVYALDKDGNKRNEQWLKGPWPGMIHDCAITENFIILVMWPFEADMDRIRAGKHHWAWNPDRPASFIVVARRPGKYLPPGWKEGESRVYEWENCICMHTAGAWEDEDGKLYMESSRIFGNELPWFPPDEPPSVQPPVGKADFVRWQFDLANPDRTKIPNPQVILDLPSEFPRIDERFMSKKYEYIFLNAILDSEPKPGVMAFLDGLAMINTKSGEIRYFHAGPGSTVQEPVFIPRSEEAPEGDGWILAMVERRETNTSHLIVLDTRSFEEPVAIVQLPFKVQAQIHGNWVPSSQLRQPKSLVREVGDVQVSGKGALEEES